MPGNFLKLLSKHLPGAKFSIYLSKAFKFTWGRGFLKFIGNLKAIVRAIKIKYENFPLYYGNWCLEHKMTCYILSHGVFLRHICLYLAGMMSSDNSSFGSTENLSSLKLYNYGWSYACLIPDLLLERCPVIQVKFVRGSILGILLDVFQKWNIYPVKCDRLT